jgi:hypothetical protein
MTPRAHRPSLNCHGEMEGREGEARRARKARGRRGSLAASHCPPATGAIVACTTPDLLLKRPDKTFAIYV